jgi:hypothetical protein
MDNCSVLTSGDAGVIIPVSIAPLHRGDSASGRIMINMELAEMPRPLENAVVGRVQSWFIPRPSLPHFSGLDEYTHAFHGKNITQLGAAGRTPPSLYDTVGTGAIAAAQSSEFFKSLGISLVASTAINTDYIDAYNVVCNFRRAAYSSKTTRYDYYQENATTALELKPAFWPRNRMHNVVPDYEQALVIGSLDLDVTSGSIPVSGLGVFSGSNASTNANIKKTGGVTQATGEWFGGTALTAEEDPDNANFPKILVEMAGEVIGTSLADIDKARTTQAFAKAQAAMAGNDYSGFNNDDVIISELMQGFVVPEELFNRPWLLDNKTVQFGMQERHATDAANLDDSVTIGRASTSLSINVPRAEYGGVILTTIEVMPERLYERQSDEYIYCTTVDDLPNALRDLQRTEPVDIVINRRMDTAHTTPAGTFGYEPMNSKWQREFTRLGGEFRQLTPGTPSTIARTAIWQPDIVDPAFTSDHYECPHPFPQDVFSVPSNDIVNISVVQQITIVGHTQFGDELVEDNGEFLAIEAEQL